MAERLVHQFEAPIITARLLKRYKRYLADVELADGQQVTVHCPNPGRLTSVLPHCQTVFLSDLREHPRKGRKLDFRWEMALVEDTHVVVNTQIANKVASRILNDRLADFGLPAEGAIKSEVSYTSPEGTRSRFDFAHTIDDGDPIYIEVKQVSLRVADADGRRWGAFPDAVTARGTRHLKELTKLVQTGKRAILCYIVARNDVDAVRSAHEIDPTYAEAFAEAQRAGVEMFACRLKARPEGIFFDAPIPVERHR